MGNRIVTTKGSKYDGAPQHFPWHAPSDTMMTVVSVAHNDTEDIGSLPLGEDQSLGLFQSRIIIRKDTPRRPTSLLDFQAFRIFHN
jgi:hypothetical protein